MQTNNIKSTKEDDTILWYAMSAPYNREQKAEALLKANNIEHFIPMRRIDRIENGNRIITNQPVVRNLLFVRASKNRILQLKAIPQYNPLLQFKMHHRLDGKTTHIIIPDKQMNDFITVYNTSDHSSIIFLDPSELHTLRENAKVRIVDGEFKDCEGYYQRVKGSARKRFVVKIECFMACATFLTECDYVLVP